MTTAILLRPEQRALMIRLLDEYYMETTDLEQEEEALELRELLAGASEVSV